MQKTNSTVLIVDDEPFGRDNLEMLLVNQGYNLAFAANGFDALAQAAKLIPDLILLDVMMPDMDGFETCRRLRSDVLLRDVPVILVTALDDRDSRLLGIEAGADDFVTKPFDRAELRTRVRTITRLNRFRRLLAERTKFEWVVEQADDGYLISDDAGNIHYANTKARLYLGLPSDDSTPMTETFHQLIRKQYHAQPETAWAIWPDSDHDSPRYLVRPETPSSKPFWLRVDTLQLNSSDNAPWVVHLRDVTAQMVVKQDKWQFQAMVAHKFRTPLIPLVTGMDLLINYGEDFSIDEIKDIAGKAILGIQRLQSEIEDILTYLHASKRQLSAKTLNLDEIAAMVDQISTDLQIESVSITIDPELISSGLTLAIPANSMNIILREILENSKKFHPARQPIVTINLSKARYSPSLVIRAADNGVMLSSEQLAQVWTPYYQGEKYFTGESTGMGLGLAMVASTVWNAGGKCRMYNQDPGPGVVVELIIPFETDEEQNEGL